MGLLKPVVSGLWRVVLPVRVAIALRGQCAPCVCWFQAYADSCVPDVGKLLGNVPLVTPVST
jgi:hypothetical protein